MAAAEPTDLTVTYDEGAAFVGTRPPVPDKLSEPLRVIVDHRMGQQVTHSLWQ